ncbi:MAG: GGDEF domain-containing protein [Solirubrobacteraceae bacterium]|nr:GGDEF domain-containing protein [Solirubrobacteraceae bacterium]
MAFPRRISASPGDPVRSRDRVVLGQRVAGTMALVSSLTAYLGVATLGMSTVAGTVQFSLGVLLTVLGIFLWISRPSRTLQLAAGLLGVTVISAMLATADEFGTTPFFYLWPTVFIAYFWSPRALAATIATMAGTFIPALVLADVSWAVGIDYFIGTTLSVGFVAGLVSLMQTREIRLNQQLSHAAHTDPLTGLLNRRGFDPRFAQLIQDSVELDRPISVVMFDLDHFKRFNDQHGHLVGDDALRRVALILAAQCREQDLVARLGGEEFAVVLPGAAPHDALSYAERVAWALGSERVDQSLRITTSSGIGSFAPGDESVSALVLRADEALYAAKAAGRARAAWWNDGELVLGDTIIVPDEAEALRAVPAVPREYILRRNDRLDEELLHRASA